MTIGFYTGKTYENNSDIIECCFNVHDDITKDELTPKKTEFKNKCLSCMDKCKAISPCLPCQLEKEKELPLAV